MIRLWRHSISTTQVEISQHGHQIIYYVLGHGVNNANIKLNMWTYEKCLEGDTAHTIHQAREDSPSGDCLVGTTGTLFPVEAVKRRILELISEKWTMTLDMCRGLAMRGGPKQQLHVQIL